MVQPQRIGRFLGLDEFGHIKPDVAVHYIGAVWKPLVSFVTDALAGRPDVRSVYLRGSIPRGLAIENASDADFIYLSDIDFDSADILLAQVTEAKFPFVRELELLRLDQATFARVYPPQQRPYFHMLLKTQCLFLAGDDLTGDIEPFRIGPDLVSHVFTLSAEFSELASQFEQNHEDGDERALRQWFSRRIVRSGLEVTMDRCNRYTRDLYPCYEQFSEFYPDRSEQMFRVVSNCLSGDENPLEYGELVAFLVRESKRLLVASDRR
jgi:hypothetical protein